jgi:hypothetical protein
MNFFGSVLSAPPNVKAGALPGSSASYALGPGDACHQSDAQGLQRRETRAHGAVAGWAWPSCAHLAELDGLMSLRDELRAGVHHTKAVRRRTRGHRVDDVGGDVVHIRARAFLAVRHRPDPPPPVRRW